MTDRMHAHVQMHAYAHILFVCDHLTDWRMDAALFAAMHNVTAIMEQDDEIKLCSTGKQKNHQHSACAAGVEEPADDHHSTPSYDIISSGGVCSVLNKKKLPTPGVGQS